MRMSQGDMVRLFRVKIGKKQLGTSGYKSLENICKMGNIFHNQLIRDE